MTGKTHMDEADANQPDLIRSAPLLRTQVIMTSVARTVYLGRTLSPPLAQMRMRAVCRYLALAVLLAATMSCGDAVRTGRSSVFLVIDSLQAAQGSRPTSLGGTLTSDVLTNVTTPAPCSAVAPCPTVFNDVGQVVLRLSAKDISVAPTTNNQVTVSRYHVTYRRADGRHTAGVDVPFSFDSAVTATVPATGTVSIGFELVRIVAKKEAPLVQLVSNLDYMTTIADVTFYGRDQVGNDIDASGSISIVFGNYGDF